MTDWGKIIGLLVQAAEVKEGRLWFKIGFDLQDINGTNVVFPPAEPVDNTGTGTGA